MKQTDRTHRAQDAFTTIAGSSADEFHRCGPRFRDSAILGNVENNSWVKYHSLDFGLGASYFEATVSSLANGGTIRIYVRKPGADADELVGQCEVFATGSWDEFVTIHCQIKRVMDENDLRLEFGGSAEKDLFNLASFTFASSMASLVRDPFVRIDAASADTLSSGLLVDSCEDVGVSRCLARIPDGSGIAFSRVNFGLETNYFEARVLSPDACRIDLHVSDIDNEASALVASLEVDAADSWTTVGVTIPVLSGIHSLELVFNGDDAVTPLQLAWFRFSKVLSNPRAKRHAAGSRIAASSFSSYKGLQVEECAEGGKNLGYIQNSSFAVYDEVDFSTRAPTLVRARTAAAFEGAWIDVFVDFEKVSRIDVPATGGWQKWSSVESALPRIEAGVHRVTLEFRGGPGFILNIAWFEFE